MVSEFDAALVVDQVTKNLKAKFPDASESEVRAVVAEEVESLSHKPVTDYVAVLSERSARARLKKSSEARGGSLGARSPTTK